MSDALNKIDDFAKKILMELLEQCTPTQQAFFKTLYPEGIENMSKEKISGAIKQCENTIKENQTNAGCGG